jgi:site-specific DNA-cytosine methylase
MYKCKHCGARISPKRQFCSDKCRVYWHRRRNKPVTAILEEEKPVILSLCDFSGNWCAPYRESGAYEVIQLDLALGTDIRLYKLPATRLANSRVRGILAAPPCTKFSLAGNRTRARITRTDLLEALSVVDACLRLIAVLQPVWWALENPRGTIAHYLGPAQWTFQPYQYGSEHSKFTCLWGKFNPPQYSPVQPFYSLTDSTKDPQQRSVTPIEFARAFFYANP